MGVASLQELHFTTCWSFLPGGGYSGQVIGKSVLNVRYSTVQFCVLTRNVNHSAAHSVSGELVTRREGIRSREEQEERREQEGGGGAGGEDDDDE